MSTSVLWIALATSFLSTVLCAGDQCGDCAPTGNRYACVDEFSYGFCFNMGFVHLYTITSCPDDFYCTVDGTYCSPIQSSTPSCVLTSSTQSTDTTETSTQQFTDSTDTSMPTSTESSTIQSTDSTDTSMPTSTESSTIQSTDSTDTSLPTSTESSTIQSTDSTDTSMPTSTESSTMQSTDSTETSTPSTVWTDLSTPDSTAWTETTPTTELPQIDPNLFCEGKNKGYYCVELTCNRYVYCYTLSKEYYGWLYYCDTNAYYSFEQNRCVNK
ncbi:integumentary mucin C.1 [Drosophila busckii]|uniref:integumentary mucin C.1 n=1 Tax=Drosophila busckii TaxID=30019 RepID=UPI001432CAFA|nr:integumentary mucin C.1 [Drosophila busckii]